MHEIWLNKQLDTIIRHDLDRQLSPFEDYFHQIL
jgi:hypothetical protein